LVFSLNSRVLPSSLVSSSSNISHPFYVDYPENNPEILRSQYFLGCFPSSFDGEQLFYLQNVLIHYARALFFQALFAPVELLFIIFAAVPLV